MSSRGHKRKRSSNHFDIWRSAVRSTGARSDVFDRARDIVRNAVRPRGGGPRSRAGQQRQAQRVPIPQGRVMNEGTGGQYSMFTGKKGKNYLPPHVENALAPISIQNSGAMQVQSTVGLQNAISTLDLFAPGIATAYTGDKITRVVYDHASGDVTLNNVQLSNAYVIIYDIVARKDVGSSSIATPLSAWSQGNTDEGTSNVYKQLGSTPWQSELFNQYYKVKQITNVVLCAGGTHVHKVRLTPKK